MVRIALVLATLGVLAACQAPMEGQGLGPLNGSAADLPAPGSAGMEPAAVANSAANAMAG